MIQFATENSHRHDDAVAASVGEKKQPREKSCPWRWKPIYKRDPPQQTMRSSSTGVHKHYALASYASFLPGDEHLKNQAFTLYKIDERSKH
jgi:hypothetical protein